jgi:hypothetical protein
VPPGPQTPHPGGNGARRPAPYKPFVMLSIPRDDKAPGTPAARKPRARAAPGAKPMRAGAACKIVPKRPGGRTVHITDGTSAAATALSASAPAFTFSHVAAGCSPREAARVWFDLAVGPVAAHFAASDRDACVVHLRVKSSAPWADASSSSSSSSQKQNTPNQHGQQLSQGTAAIIGFGGASDFFFFFFLSFTCLFTLLILVKPQTSSL